MNEIHAIVTYFALIAWIAIASYSKKADTADFFVGKRSMNYWLTALSAHASDMSSWLFMAYPATIFLSGLFKAWVAIGLLLFMYLNWRWVAPKIRIATEKTQALTFFSYLERKFKDKHLILTCTLICFFFYSVYIASGLIGMGLLIENIYGLSYTQALLGSVFIVLLCVSAGGYRTLAWIDLFQGCFLLAVLLFVPAFLLYKLGGWACLSATFERKGISLSLFPDFSAATFFQLIVMVLGWGLGYFGQPAIITKFMGIQKVEEISRAKNVGMVWMFLSLAAASCVGLVATGFFQGDVLNPEMIFIDMVQATFHPFFAGFILCAVFAATINVVSSQMLVIGSSFFEDIYKRFAKAPVNSLLVTKAVMLLVAFIGFAIAYFKVSSIYNLVLYAWSGLGAAFGPLLIFSLYSKNTHRAIGWAAVLSGSLAAGLWPWIDAQFQTGVDSMLVGFGLSFASIGLTSLLTRYRPALSN